MGQECVKEKYTSINECKRDIYKLQSLIQLLNPLGVFWKYININLYNFLYLHLHLCI